MKGKTKGILIWVFLGVMILELIMILSLLSGINNLYQINLQWQNAVVTLENCFANGFKECNYIVPQLI